MITVYRAPDESTSPKWVDAFVRGYPGKANIVDDARPYDGPIALWGSPRFEGIVARARKGQADWYFGDHGFFGRGTYYRCARNTTMFDGASGDDDPARFRSFGLRVRDWRKTGSHILVCPNSQEFLDRNGAPNWLDETLTAIKNRSDRLVRVRWKAEAKKRPLSLDLLDAWAVVTFMSNAAVEAVIAGVPTFCARPCAALTMGTSDLSQIENPLMPDGREQWAARLANNQWTLAEMARGDLWRSIGQ